MEIKSLSEEIECRIVSLNQENVKKYLNDLIELDLEIFNEMGLIYSDEKWTKTEFLYDLKGKWKYSMLALIDGKVVGFLIASINNKTSIHINRIAVKNRFRSIKIGKMLIELLHENAYSNNIEYITLFVCCSNLSTIEFYNKFGYEKLANDRLFDFLVTKKKEKFYKIDYVERDNNQQYYALHKKLKER